MTTNDTQDPAKEESTSQSGRVLYTKGPTFTDAPTVALDTIAKTVRVTLPEGWSVDVQHATPDARIDDKPSRLNVMGMSYVHCVVRTLTAPIPENTSDDEDSIDPF